MSKVYHIEIKREDIPQRDRHQYFGSKTGVFDVFSPEQIGITKQGLWDINFKDAPRYENEHCIIRLGSLHRTKTNRGKN